MKILLIGHSIIDEFEGEEEQTPKPGGLFYTSLGIVSVAKPNDKIFLLTSWNDESIELFRNVYSQTDMSFSNKIDNMPGVILKTSHQGEREETYTNLSSQLSIEGVTDWKSFDGIMINMITGFDLSIEQLKCIRSKFAGTIYMDFHTLARGVDQNMKREFRPIPDVKEWLASINVIQVNESELKTVCELEDELACAKEILNSGPQILVVTKGERGSSLYMREDGNIRNMNVNAVKINLVNKVGCGDIFGAAFFYSYISTKDAVISLSAANKAGAVAASLSNLTNYSRLKLNDI